MQTRISNGRSRRRGAGFSLVELLVAVSIMLVIIYALYAMFNQTQKALRANITQVDVMESGRAVAEMIGRELEQVTASDMRHTNLFTRVSPVFEPLNQLDLEPSQSSLRTNLLHEFFFLSRQGNRWMGTGYLVSGANPEHGVGTLYRFTTSVPRRELPYHDLLRRFLSTPISNSVTRSISTNFSAVAEGIVHLRLTAYDSDGRRLGWETTNIPSSYRVLRYNRANRILGLNSSAASHADAQIILQQSLAGFRAAQLETQFAFVSNALPGYVELELGVLEPATYKRFKSLGENAQTAFLARQASKVHLFRQRIPIRTALQ